MSPFPNDRRVWTRYTANRRTVDLSQEDTEEISWAARLQDLSRSGLGLLFRRPFELGARLTVEFLISGRENPILHIEGIFFRRHGVESLSVSYAQQTSQEQDRAAVLALRREGYPTKRGGLWHGKVVRDVLRTTRADDRNPAEETREPSPRPVVPSSPVLV